MTQEKTLTEAMDDYLRTKQQELATLKAKRRTVTHQLHKIDQQHHRLSYGINYCPVCGEHVSVKDYDEDKRTPGRHYTCPACKRAFSVTLHRTEGLPKPRGENTPTLMNPKQY